MIRKELLTRVTWRDSAEARLEYFSPLFGKNSDIHILTITDGSISERSFQIIEDFLGLSDLHLEKIKQFLWEDCKLNCEISSYGFDVPDGRNEVQINHEEFGVQTGDDALKKSTLKYLLISEYDQESYPNNYGHLQFDNEWNSHLTTIVMKNGNIVGCGDSGLNLGQWEK
jgi:hypothetical protein